MLQVGVTIRNTWLFTAIQNRKILEDLNEQVRIGFGLLPVAESDYPAKIRAKQNAQKKIIISTIMLQH